MAGGHDTKFFTEEDIEKRQNVRLVTTGNPNKGKKLGKYQHLGRKTNAVVERVREVEKAQKLVKKHKNNIEPGYSNPGRVLIANGRNLAAKHRWAKNEGSYALHRGWTPDRRVVVPRPKKIKMPPIFKPLWFNDKRVVVLSGGRGSGKSTSAFAFVLDQMRKSRIKVLVCRKSKTSLDSSSKELMEDLIYEGLGWEKWFTITRTQIVCKTTGSTALFRGLEYDPGSLRGEHNVTLLVVEEAQYISRVALTSLIPTVRGMSKLGEKQKKGDKGKEQMIFVLNPQYEDDPVYYDYVLHGDKKNVLHIHANLDDNPFARELTKELRDADWKKVQNGAMDESAWENKWLGELDRKTSDLILRENLNWGIGKLDESGPMHFGMDVGNADPTVVLGVRDLGDKRLYVRAENVVLRGGVTSERMQEFVRRVGAKTDDIVWSDSQATQTETGIIIRHVKKGQDFFIKTLNMTRDHHITVHPSCKFLIDNLRKYRYKKHPRTDVITEVPMAGNDHGPDALRYAVWGAFMNKRRPKKNKNLDGFGPV